MDINSGLSSIRSTAVSYYNRFASSGPTPQDSEYPLDPGAEEKIDTAISEIEERFPQQRLADIERSVDQAYDWLYARRAPKARKGIGRKALDVLSSLDPISAREANASPGLIPLALLIAIALIFLGCPSSEIVDDDDNDTTACIDEDGDGHSTCYGESQDCDDNNASIYPGAPEVPCDDIDQDCDGADYTPDDDGDGFTVCDDCDDNNNSIYPGAAEISCDGIDQDCNGVDLTPDEDGDGYACDDCDDADPNTYPGAVELCDEIDNNCDGIIPDDEVDNDLDGYLACFECDDADPNTYPGATELCDGIDNNCDGVIPADEYDNDGDGYIACLECDDADPNTYPGAPELCDEVDNNCNGVIPADEVDDDGDGYMACEECDDVDYYVNPGMTEDWCNGIDDNCDGIFEADADGDGYYAECDDCEDASNTIYPGAPEIECDGIDQDCDGTDLGGMGLSGSYDLNTAHASFIGEEEYNYAGYSVSSAGDVDGDGYDDLLVGAWKNDDGGTYAGKAYLIYGPAYGSIDLSIADASFVGENSGDYAGYSVSNAGDVDGDGYDDLLMAAHYNGDGGTRAGKTYLIYGPAYGSIDLSSADAFFIGENSYNYAGYSVSNAGDVDGDGYDDVLIGAWANDDGGSVAGKAYLIYGPAYGSIDLSIADASFVGENAGDHAGGSVSSAGDVDGDGYDDLLIGAYGNDDGGADAGKAYLIYGPVYGSIDLSAADASFIGENADDRAGYSVSSAGDVDGDGYDDLLVGAWKNADGGADAGKAYLIYGPAYGDIDLSVADASFIGENSGDWAGYSVSSAGDVDGDGYDDLLMAAHFNSDGGPGAGKTYLIYGPAYGSIDLSIADAFFIGEDSFDYAGHSVSNAGDVDGDGYDDLLVGAYYNNDGGTYAGKAYLIYGHGCP